MHGAVEFGGYLDPQNDRPVHRENVERHLSDCTRTAPIHRKTYQQLRYLALNSNYSIDVRYSNFTFCEIQSINMLNGQNVIQVRRRAPNSATKKPLYDEIGYSNEYYLDVRGC